MNVTAESVRQLRERTGAGMMECKRALVETGGDLDTAAELMRKQGLAKADKKATRVAAEGVIATGAAAPTGTSAVLVEINCETDFVARGDDFTGFAKDVAERDAGRASRPTSRRCGAQKLPSGETVDERRRALIAKIGENISVRRFERVESHGRCWAATCTARASARWWRSRVATPASRKRPGHACGGQQSALSLGGRSAGGRCGARSATSASRC